MTKRKTKLRKLIAIQDDIRNLAFLGKFQFEPVQGLITIDKRRMWEVVFGCIE